MFEESLDRGDLCCEESLFYPVGELQGSNGDGLLMQDTVLPVKIVSLLHVPEEDLTEVVDVINSKGLCAGISENGHFIRIIWDGKDNVHVDLLFRPQYHKPHKNCGEQKPIGQCV